MNKKVLFLSSFLLLLCFSLIFGFQIDPEKVKNHKEWEIFLKSAEITGHEDIGEGITKPKKLFLKRGEIKECGVWKNPEGIQKGFKDEWRYEIAIDHSRAFRTKRVYTDQLIYGKHGLRSTMLFSKLPRKFFDEVKSLNYDKIKKATEGHLNFYEIEAVLARKKLLVKEVKEMIKERGGEDVLY